MNELKLDYIVNYVKCILHNFERIRKEMYNVSHYTNIPMKKNKLLVSCVICLSMVLSFSVVAMAGEYEKAPSFDQINPGDTMFKDDGNIKAFDKYGNLIYSGPQKYYYNTEYSIKDSTGGSLGNYEGYTDIWWEYGLVTDLTGSGPSAESCTRSYDVGGSEYLYVKSELYEKNSQNEWTRIAYNTCSEYNETIAECQVEEINYHALAWTNGFKCETKHKIEDDDEGWDAIFYTDDEF